MFSDISEIRIEGQGKNIILKNLGDAVNFLTYYYRYAVFFSLLVDRIQKGGQIPGINIYSPSSCKIR